MTWNWKKYEDEKPPEGTEILVIIGYGQELIMGQIDCDSFVTVDNVWYKAETIEYWLLPDLPAGLHPQRS